MYAIRSYYDLCPRTIVLKEGRLMADGPTEALFNNQDLLDACHLEKPLRMQACPVSYNFV